MTFIENNAEKDGFVIQKTGSPRKKASSSLGTCRSVLLLNQNHLKLFHWNSTMKKALKESAVWKKHLNARQWLNTMWLCIPRSVIACGFMHAGSCQVLIVLN